MIEQRLKTLRDESLPNDKRTAPSGRPSSRSTRSPHFFPDFKNPQEIFQRK